MRALFLLLLCFIIEEISAQGSPQFVFDRSEINIYDRDAEIKSIAVYAGSLQKSKLSNAEKILGQASQIKKGFKYRPLVPLSFETPYTLVYNDHIKHFFIQLPEDYKKMTVVAIHPASKEIPSNLLKWYVEFSRSVNPTNIYDYINIANHQGNPLDRAILPLESPLLSEDGKLLTLWMEPGRQKRGLLPNQELGAILEVGQSYELQIDPNLKDENGIRMQPYESLQFNVGIADRRKPDINRWDISLPSINTKMALLIAMDEMMDFGSIMGHVGIYSEDIEVQGQWTYNYQKNQLEFLPFNNWISGSYAIIFDPTIEDLAGNNLLHLFDRDTAEKMDAYSVQATREFILK